MIDVYLGLFRSFISAYLKSLYFPAKNCASIFHKRGTSLIEILFTVKFVIKFLFPTYIRNFSLTKNVPTDLLQMSNTYKRPDKKNENIFSPLMLKGTNSAYPILTELQTMAIGPEGPLPIKYLGPTFRTINKLLVSHSAYCRAVTNPR